MNESSLWIVLHRMRLPFLVILVTYTIAMVGFFFIPGVDDKGDVYQMSIFDAFYFVSYTATTIGYGEYPFPFTYYQKIWASVSIYISVLGWFYGIGALVSLFQDKLFLSEIAISRFQRTVKNLKEDFVIVLGYNETTKEIIKRMLRAKVRVVVIEKNQTKADYLKLEGFIPPVPVLVYDVYNPKALEDAGISSKYCNGIISLFKSPVLNLRITLSAKLLNPDINVVVKSTTHDETMNLLDAGANIVNNPFSILSYQLQTALRAPSLFKLENWLYKASTLEIKNFAIPDSNILICGYGRLGSYLYDMFENNNIQPYVIESNKDKVDNAIYLGKKNIIHGRAENQLYLDKAKVKDAKLILLVTDDDTTNLSILSTIKKLNSKAVIIARENDITDFSIFSHANIDHLYLLDKILINKTTNALSYPLNDRLIRLVVHKDEAWGKELLAKLINTLGVNPMTFELHITEEESYEIFKYLKQKDNFLTLDALSSSRANREEKNNLIPLLVLRKGEEIILPESSFELSPKDKILFACDANAREDLESIANNAFEFNYILTGEEKKFFFK